MNLNETIYERDIKKWKRPWHYTAEEWKTLENKDDRFFSVLMKGILMYLNNAMVLYNKPINHYILSTGSEYLYVEKNGYLYSMNTVTGENTLYSKLPRCTITPGNISVDRSGLSLPFARGNYERHDNGELKTYNAEIRRIPIQWSLSLQYTFATFNEGIVFTEEIINNLLWQKYFEISYLGQEIMCSIEFPDNLKIDFNAVDYASTETKNKTMVIELIVKTNYPQINVRSEIDASKVIEGMIVNVNPHSPKLKTVLDEDNNQRIYKD